MSDLEAVAILSDLKAGLTPKQSVAVLKGIQALTEKMLRQAKAEQLKKQYKNKCRDCEQFSFGDGGLNPCYGNCALKDPPFDYTRKANNRACKRFVKYTEEV